MSENSKIEWCDHTFNPWIGCTKVSPGCANCYAETQDKFRSWTPDGWGKGKPRKRTSDANWKKPLKWNEEAERLEGLWDLHVALCRESGITDFKQAWIDKGGEGEPWRRPRVFCASLADWLDEEVPIEWLVDLLDLIRQPPHLDWLLLTKRPKNFYFIESIHDEMLDSYNDDDLSLLEWLADWYQGLPPDNVWVGTSVEDQKRAEERIPALIEIPAVVRFLSCEPLLEKVDLGDWLIEPVAPDIHWVIVGGESGPGCRHFSADWAYDLLWECYFNNVAFFMKQMGGNRKPFKPIPEEVMVREFPEGGVGR